MLTKYDKRTVSEESGAVVGGATVNFYVQGGGPANVYSDVNGAVSLGTSVVSDSQGRVSVFMHPGLYRITVTVGGSVVEELTYVAITSPMAYADPDNYAFYSSGDTPLVSRNVADLKLAGGPRLSSARVLSVSEVAQLASIGATITTGEYHSGTAVGGATYRIWTLTAYQTFLGNGGWIPDGHGNHYLLGGTTYVAVLVPAINTMTLEQFGASASRTSAQNASSINACINSLKDGQIILQESLSLDTGLVEKTNVSTGNTLHIRLRSVGNSAFALVTIRNSPEVTIRGRIDLNGNRGICLNINNCPRAILPKDLWVGNVSSDNVISAGVFMRDSDDCKVECTVDGVHCNTAASRGIMISDQIITKNTSTISPTVRNITSNSAGAGVAGDADGVYAEFSTSGYIGGLKIINGYYENCGRRYIKLTSPHPVIKNNIGRSTLPNMMHGLIASYDTEAGFISNNDMESGVGGSSIAVDFAPATPSTAQQFVIEANRFLSVTTTTSSKAFNVSGYVKQGLITVGECRGFESLFFQTGTTSDTGQSLIIGSGIHDNTSAGVRNCVVIVGDYSKLKIHDITCVTAVASSVFVQAPNISDNVLEIVNCRHAYAFGKLSGPARERTSTDYNSTITNFDRVDNGRKIGRRDSIPTTGAWRVGDIIERVTPAVDGNSMVLTGWLCTTTGTPGTWVPLRISTVSPAI